MPRAQTPYRGAPSRRLRHLAYDTPGSEPPHVWGAATSVLAMITLSHASRSISVQAIRHGRERVGDRGRSGSRRHECHSIGPIICSPAELYAIDFGSPRTDNRTSGGIMCHDAIRVRWCTFGRPSTGLEIQSPNYHERPQRLCDRQASRVHRLRRGSFFAPILPQSRIPL